VISVAIQHPRHTSRASRENQTFSVIYPSESLAVSADYCGIVSGGKTDKVKDCDFKVSYGELITAPLIEECPRQNGVPVSSIRSNLGSHNLVIGEVIQCHVSEDCLNDGKPDPARIKPLIYGDSQYWALGKALGPAFKIGQSLKPRQPD
jgi:flavin reductase (DIM6/NTAB) family NADH-FMN oxidoreductase RutF